MKILKQCYTIPKLCTAKNDITKDWFVYFYYTDRGVKKLFRYKMGINYLKTAKERTHEANSIISALTIKLKSGWNPFYNEIEKEKQTDIPICVAFDNILNTKKSYLTPRSYKTYYDQTNLFKKYLRKKKLGYLFVQNIRDEHIRGFLDYLLTEKKYCGKSYNVYLTVLKTFFNAFVERNYIKESPMRRFKPVRQDYGKNVAYSTIEEKRLVKVMKKQDIDFYYSTRFVKYLFLRRTELANLKVKNIIWENKTIVISSNISKSRIQDSITIPKSLEKIIIKMGILELDPETYIFGKHFRPSLIKCKRVDDFSDKQRKLNRENNIKKECSFYSWKHTGTVELYQRTKDPYIVMRQCRHSDIKITMTYLRSLGCGVNEQVREW